MKGSVLNQTIACTPQWTAMATNRVSFCAIKANQSLIGLSISCSQDNEEVCISGVTSDFDVT